MSGHLREALLARAEARIDLRNRRAERLARLRSAAVAPEAAGRGEAQAVLEAPADPAVPAGDVEALERFLAGLLGTIDAEPEPLPQPARLSPPVIALARRSAEAVPSPLGDAAGLAGLPGAGQGLVAALSRAGVPDLETLARADAPDLRARLGPLALLIDVGDWVRYAQDQMDAAAARG
jgi:hypothetical protein